MDTVVKVMVYLSDLTIPILIFYVVTHGILAKRPVYDDFVKGAKEGFHTVIQILPTLVGLMVAVGVLRASGFLELLADLFGWFTKWIYFPSELIPLTLVRMFSSSAATGLALDIFKEFGTDSYLGILTSILLSCSETVFYTMSIYFVTAKVQKIRHTFAGAMLATAADILMSIILARLWMSQ